VLQYAAECHAHTHHHFHHLATVGVAVCCSVLQHIAACCSVFQSVAAYYGMLQHVAVSLTSTFQRFSKVGETHTLAIISQEDVSRLYIVVDDPLFLQTF